MNSKLPCGHYLGQVVRCQHVAGLILTETRHAPKAQLPLHAHENAYICLVRHGTYTEVFGNRTRTCGPLTLAFHPPGEIHAERMGERDVHSFNIELDGGWTERIRACDGLVNCPADFQGGRLAHLALRLFREFREMDNASSLVVEGLTLELLGEASRCTAGPGARRPPRWLHRARELLRARFRENFSLTELAATVGAHPVYLASSFRRHFRSTMGEYVRQLRIDFAASRMSGSTVSLAEIALDAGFADQSHFCRTFKRLMGVTPGQYREGLSVP